MVDHKRSSAPPAQHPFQPLAPLQHSGRLPQPLAYNPAYSPAPSLQHPGRLPPPLALNPAYLPAPSLRHPGQLPPPLVQHSAQSPPPLYNEQEPGPCDHATRRLRPECDRNGKVMDGKPFTDFIIGQRRLSELISQYVAQLREYEGYVSVSKVIAYYARSTNELLRTVSGLDDVTTSLREEWMTLDPKDKTPASAGYTDDELVENTFDLKTQKLLKAYLLATTETNNFITAPHTQLGRMLRYATILYFVKAQTSYLLVKTDWPLEIMQMFTHHANFVQILAQIIVNYLKIVMSTQMGPLHTPLIAHCEIAEFTPELMKKLMDCHDAGRKYYRAMLKRKVLNSAWKRDRLDCLALDLCQALEKCETLREELGAGEFGYLGWELLQMGIALDGKKKDVGDDHAVKASGKEKGMKKNAGNGDEGIKGKGKEEECW